MVYGLSQVVLWRRVCALLAAGICICGGGVRADAITIDIQLACNLGETCAPGDFFFDHPAALDDLNFVAQAYTPFADSLSAISGATVTFTHPDTGAVGTQLSNFATPADAVTIYVGGRDLQGNQVGAAGPGGPDGAFARGQGTIVGEAADDFAIWGGVIAFDTKTTTGADRNWHFGFGAPPGPGTVDFISVALHELGHVFGFGTADSFENQVSSSEFQGAAAATLYGGSVPVLFNPGSFNHEHWAGAVTSPPYVEEPTPSFGPSLVSGRRTLLTPLDYAGLQDVGWEVPAQLLGLHGNADNDGDVDGVDFLAWQRGFGTTSGANALMGDLNGQGAVDNYDLWLWEQNYGATSTPSGLAAPMQIPEPAAWCLLAVGVLSLSRKRSNSLSALDSYKTPAINTLPIAIKTQ